MLVGKSQDLDLQLVGIAKQTVECDTKRMGGQAGSEAGAKPPKRVGTSALDTYLLDQLPIDGLDDLAEPLDHTGQLGG